MPNTHASVAHTTIANIAALTATMASCELEPKSTILVIVSATVAFTFVIRNTPRKLKTAAIKIAALADIQRVTTQVAMALGASVQPFTMITPSVRMTATNRSGLSVICCQKYCKERSIFTLSIK